VVELRLREIFTCLAQSFVGLPQFTDLALQRLNSATSVGTPPHLPLSTSAILTYSCGACGTKPIFLAIDTTPIRTDIPIMIESNFEPTRKLLASSKDLAITRI